MALSLSALLPLSVGNAAGREVMVQPSDIPSLFDEAERQALTGVVGEVVSGLIPSTDDLGEYEDAYFEWMGEMLRIEEDNNMLNTSAGELTAIFREAGFRTCVLKGQGVAQLYPEPLRREVGDIDLWVDADRETVLRFLKSRWTIGKPCIHHVDVQIFPDIPVEVHWMPAWLYNPFANRRLQRFFKKEADKQFSNMSSWGFAYPTIIFNLVYMAIHIYKHTFYENLLLKQLVDYFYVLKHSTSEERKDAMALLSGLGLSQFSGYLMWRLSTELDLEEEYLLCKPDSRCRQPFQEAIFVYPWKAWHWGWRKWKGYL